MTLGDGVRGSFSEYSDNGPLSPSPGVIKGGGCMEYDRRKLDKESFEQYRTVLAILAGTTDFSVGDLERYKVIKSKSYDERLGAVREILSEKNLVKYRSSMHTKGDTKSRGHEFVRCPEEEPDNPFAEFFYHSRSDEALIIIEVLLLSFIKNGEGVSFKDLWEYGKLEEELLTFSEEKDLDKRISDALEKRRNKLIDTRVYKEYLNILKDEELIFKKGIKYYVSDNPLESLYKKWGRNREKWNRLVEYSDFLGHTYPFPAPFIFLRDRLKVFIENKNITSNLYKPLIPNTETPYIVYRHEHCERLIDSEVVAVILEAIKKNKAVKLKNSLRMYGIDYDGDTSETNFKRIEYDPESGHTITVRSMKKDGIENGENRCRVRSQVIEHKGKKYITRVFTPLRNKSILESVVRSLKNCGKAQDTEFILNTPLKAEKDVLKNIVEDLPGKEMFLTEEMCSEIIEATKSYESLWNPKDISELPVKDDNIDKHLRTGKWKPEEPEENAKAVRAEYSCKYKAWRILYYSDSQEKFYFKGADMTYELLKRVKRESSERLRKLALKRRVQLQIEIPYGTKSKTGILDQRDIWVWGQLWINKLVPYGCSKRFMEDPAFMLDRENPKPDIYYQERKMYLEFITDEEDREEIIDEIKTSMDEHIDKDGIRIT